MEAKTIGNYGGEYADAVVVENPETDMSADYGNRLLEDTAQCTQTVPRAWVSFSTTAVAAPTTVTPTHNSVWGSGAGQLPTVSKTAVGRYTVTYASSFNDGLGVSENVAFLRPLCQAWGGAWNDDLYAEVLTLASNVITIKTESPKGTLADVGNNGAAVFSVELELR